MLTITSNVNAFQVCLIAIYWVLALIPTHLCMQVCALISMNAHTCVTVCAGSGMQEVECRRCGHRETISIAKWDTGKDSASPQVQW